MKTAQKILLGLACLSLFFSCAGRNRTELSAAFNDSAVNQNRTARIAAINNSVFGISIVVKGKNFEKKYSVGTGFLIGEGLLASAFHVQARALELAEKFGRAACQTVGWKKLKTGEYVEFPIEMTVDDAESDLAIYRFDAKLLRENRNFSEAKALTLAEDLPAIGAQVVSIGYYGDYQFPFNSMGNVAMIDANDDIFSDLTLMPGNSGAPVCDLETGVVLGVTTDVLDLGNETVRYGIAKRAAKLRRLLTKF